MRINTFGPRHQFVPWLNWHFTRERFNVFGGEVEYRRYMRMVSHRRVL